MNKKDVQALRDQILLTALPQVTFDGWTWETIERAAQEAGHTPSMARAVFPDRIKDVLNTFADLADREMLAALETTKIEDLRIRDRITAALLARYVWLTPHKEALRQSLQFWAFPTRKPRGAKIVWRTADRIWNWAGDTATDYNHYTKRGLLSGIIVSTTLVWLNDASENMDKTKAFLDRRIENVMQLGKVINKVKKAS
ncbi:MAG: COQ9 family protein [Alphaproteobacteria bacterium]